MGYAVDLANAVTASINNGIFSKQFTARRVALPDVDFDKLTGTAVSVMPTGQKIEMSGRYSSEYTVTIDIGIQARCSDETDDVGTFGTLVDEIIEFLRKTALSGFPAQLVNTVCMPLYSAEHLSKMRVFTSVISADYQFQVTND